MGNVELVHDVGGVQVLLSQRIAFLSTSQNCLDVKYQ
jgi:hypothetical protein